MPGRDPIAEFLDRLTLALFFVRLLREGRFWPDSGTVVDAWAARPIVEPDDQPDDGPVMGNPHRGATTRPKPPRY